MTILKFIIIASLTFLLSLVIAKAMVSRSHEKIYTICGMLVWLLWILIPATSVLWEV